MEFFSSFLHFFYFAPACFHFPISQKFQTLGAIFPGIFVIFETHHQHFFFESKKEKRLSD